MKIFKEKLFWEIKKTIEIEEGKRGFFKAFLFFLSLFYRFFIFLKNFAYDRDLLKAQKIAIPVLSVGNIVVGGTGKTPFILYLAEKFLKKNKKVAIVSRGYGAKAAKQNQKSYLVCFAENKIYPPEEIGDEPYLIARRLPKVYVIVGRDKLKSVQMAKDLNLDVVLLDDGFQSRKVFRNVDIVLLNKDKPFSNFHFLPRGLLRDSLTRLIQADFLVINNKEDCLTEKKFQKNTSSICVFSQPQFSGIKNLKKEEQVFLSEKKVAIFCAIANPSNFYHLLKKEGFEIVKQKFFLDHSYFDKNFLKKFAREAKAAKAEALLCTEKDIVKLPEEMGLDLPIYYVEMDLKIIFNEEKIEELILNKY